jgi:hypothetical protein
VRKVRGARPYLQPGLSPALDCLPLIRLDVRPSARLLSLLLVRAGEAASTTLEADVVRVGIRLLRRLAVTLEGREARRAAGLSSVLELTCGDDTGVDRMDLAGVAGDCIGLASDRARGVVDERPDVGGDNAERLRGLLVGIAERLPEGLRDESGDSESLRKGDGVVSGL